MEIEPVVKRWGFKVNEMLALGSDSGLETTGLGVLMKRTVSLLIETVGERTEASLNEVRCLVKVSS